VFLNNRYHDPTLGTFISVDPLVAATGEAYIYASGNPTTLSDPSGLCPMSSAAAASCAAAMFYGYNAQTAVYMSASSVLPQEDAWSAWGIWSQADYCSQCEGFDIQAGSGNACLGMSGCAAAAQYLLDVTDGMVQSATDQQFADAKWLAANYCNYNDCGAGNLLALENQAEFGAAAANVLLVGGGLADDVLRAGVSASLDDQLAVASRSLDDFLRNPGSLAGRTPGEVQDLVLHNPNWRVESLGAGGHKGQGWVFREYTANGSPTGRMLRWHPGGGHHGPGPYWRAIDYNTRSGIVR
jgi:hypothetical protein